MISNGPPGRWLIVITLFFVIPALACNFPTPTLPTKSSLELPVTLTALAKSRDTEQTPAAPLEATATAPLASAEFTATPTVVDILPLGTPQLFESGTQFIYFTQTGDTLPAIAGRFGVEPQQINASQPIALQDFLPPGLELRIPNQLGKTQFPDLLLPDSEIIYSPSSIDFQIDESINRAGGYLSTYTEDVNGNLRTGAEIVQKVAAENSINPRLLLAILEYRSGWVFGEPLDPSKLTHPIGFYVPDYQGLYLELVLTATHLGVGYYGWRSGSLTRLSFTDDRSLRLNPGLNAGTVALQHFFSKLSDQAAWQQTLYGDEGFIPLYLQMYGEPWMRAAQAGPIFPDGLTQPELELPFAPGERWAFTGGPHLSWNSGSARGAIDFSPVTWESYCVSYSAWVTASASGQVVRSADNVVALDLDGDGFEQTGWVLVFLHIADQDRIPAGQQVAVDQRLGHPSCDRGNSTGINVHLARKYNGEWIAADGPIPFILSGWLVEAGPRGYQGQLLKDGQVISANPGGPSSSLIIR